MIAHRRDHCLSRQLEILVLELAAECRRILNKIQDLFEEVFRDFRRAAVSLSNFFDLLADQRLALVLVDEDEVLLAGLFVAVSIRNLKVSLGQEAVTTRRAARFDLSHFEGDDFIIQQSHDPAQRTDELEIKVRPAHVVREGQAADEIFEQILQQLSRSFAFLMNHRIDIAVFFDQVFRVNALAAGKALCCLGRIAVSIEGDLDGRSAVLAGNIFLLLSQIFYNECRTSRRADRADAAEGNAVLLECLFCILFQLGKDARHDMGRNFFRADFQ